MYPLYCLAFCPLPTTWALLNLHHWLAILDFPQHCRSCCILALAMIPLGLAMILRSMFEVLELVHPRNKVSLSLFYFLSSIGSSLLLFSVPSHPYPVCYPVDYPVCHPVSHPVIVPVPFHCHASYAPLWLLMHFQCCHLPLRSSCDSQPYIATSVAIPTTPSSCESHLYFLSLCNSPLLFFIFCLGHCPPPLLHLQFHLAFALVSFFLCLFLSFHHFLCCPFFHFSLPLLSLHHFFTVSSHSHQFSFSAIFLHLRAGQLFFFSSASPFFWCLFVFSWGFPSIVPLFFCLSLSILFSFFLALLLSI